MTRTAFILTALDCECDAVLAHLDDVQEEEHPTVGTIYWVGRFGSWRVAVAEIGAGNTNAATETERAFAHFSPALALFVGVAGGIKDVGLGDVVVGTKVYGYHSGKAAEDFQPRPDLGECTYRLTQKARSVRRGRDWLGRIQVDRSEASPKVVVGPIAAGEQVVSSTRSATFAFLRRQYGDAVAVEMEGRGFLSAAFAHTAIDAAVIRGISDLIEKKEEADAEGSQPRASAHAAAFAFELLARLDRAAGEDPPTDHLAVYRGLVAEDHSKLHGPLHLPEGMDQIRHACVEVAVQSAEGTRAVESTRLLAKDGRPTLDALLDLPPGDPPWQQGRWLLVGDPGTGKTTLLRRIASELADGDERLPVFQPLPSLVAHSGDLLDLWEQRFRDRTGHPGLGADLDAAGRAGRLVLLLDGFDEVEAGLHPRAHDLIDGFARRWPTSRVVVSTRPHGRGETTPADFVELSLLPLDDNARAEYLRRWFTAAGEADPSATLDAMVERVGGDRGLDELSRNPLYLTLLAGLWDSGRTLPERRSQLYDKIFDHLYRGKHKPRSERRPLPALPMVDAALTDLAYAWTEREEAVELFDPLTSWLLGSEHWDMLSRAADSWRREGPRRFWLDLWERTQIVGPREDGEAVEPDHSQTPWRFWHRTFREALTAKKLGTHLAADEATFLERVRELDEGRWAEPLSLLAGGLDAPGQLVEKLMEVNPRLGLRSLATVDGLDEETFGRLVKLTDKPEERAEIFEQIPEQVNNPEACLRLWDRLAERAANDLNDVYFLHWLLDEVGRRWPSHRRTASARIPRLYDALPAPTDPELFRFVETRDGRVDLWQTIPKGDGWVGSPDDEEDRHGDEGPRHRVTITRPFALAAVPVTKAQWAQLDPKKAKLDRQNHPVVEVTWWEAITFCRWLDHKVGLVGARLPSEEEWEYACRAGTETRYWSGNAVADLDRVGWYGANSDGLQPVGQKDANPWGLYDVHGNVWEWTASAWKDDYSKQKDGLTVDPADPPADLAGPRAGRVCRGGSYWFIAGRARSAFRNWDGPGFRFDVLGFRVLLPSPER